MRYSDVNLFIGGRWCEGSGERIPVYDPATEELIGSVACAGAEDLERAAAAAMQGFQVWARTSALQRSELLRRTANILRERTDSIAWVMTREQGKPLAQAAGEVSGSADMLDWLAEEARRTYGMVIPARSPSVLQLALKKPVGPVAVFTPWNFPVNQLVRKLGAALAAGCSVIAKAPEETPGSPAELVRTFEDAGLPDGVINLVYGIPTDISAYLISHPAVRKLSFTGSTSVGKHLAELAGRHMKRTTMELGGHAPVIVCADADIEQAASLLAASKFRNAGQVCVSPTRFLVDTSVADRFLDEFVDSTKKIRIGRGLDQETTMGPLANARRLDAVKALIDDALEQGAQLVAGGQRLGNHGYFFEPTILAEVPITARIMNEEPFGPVVVINRTTSLGEAIEEANRLPYGLAAYAFTQSAQSMSRLADEVEAGMITINHLGLGLAEVPFGGIKDSGYGTEGGAAALEPYLETRFVTRMERR